MTPDQKQLEHLEQMARESGAGFAAACRDPNITKEDYDKLRAQYEAAMRQHHKALGF